MAAHRLRATMGLDHGLRTVRRKSRVVDGTAADGRCAKRSAPRSGGKAATADRRAVRKYHVELVAIGNGTASREETERASITKRRYRNSSRNVTARK